MASVSHALRRIKEDLEPFLPESAVAQACREANYTWRQRQLGPGRTLHLFILQVLCFNTAMTHLRHLARTAVAAPAYCRARMRLPLKVFETLLRESSSAMERQAEADRRWCGLRTFLVDGSSSITPDTPSSQRAFGQPYGQKAGCGFPVPKVLGLFDAFTGLMIELLSFPLYTHEQSKVWMLHSRLSERDLLVGDRGFCSFVHLAMLFSRGIYGLFRMHQKQIVDFRPHRRTYHKGQTRRPRSVFLRRLGKHDQIVRWIKPKQKPAWMDDQRYAALPATLIVRELRYALSAKGQRSRCVTIATTLLDPWRYPAEKIRQLYGVRWTVETHWAELKTTLKMRRIKSQTAMGVRKELIVYALVYNLVHATMLRAARCQGVDPDRISFLDTVRCLLSSLPGDPFTHLLINPHRPDRQEPRAIKDLHDTYRKMKIPRNQLRGRPDLTIR
jgi:hypothetical protein